MLSHESMPALRPTNSSTPTQLIWRTVMLKADSAHPEDFMTISPSPSSSNFTDLLEEFFQLSNLVRKCHCRELSYV